MLSYLQTSNLILPHDLNSTPTISCLLVTANRLQLCRRAIRCYSNQTWPNKELVIIDDGQEDLTPILTDIPESELVYLRLSPSEGNLLGKLRNMALDAARGDYLAQWDDDDWYHPERLERQARILDSGFDACVLGAALMHLDTEEFFDHPYIGILKEGVPGTIMHRRDSDVRYPELPRAEDTHYLKSWLEKRFIRLPDSEMYLFIRCFHGSNTWEQSHFLTRLHNRFPDLVSYGWHKYIRRNVFAHNRFEIGHEGRKAFAAYLKDSIDLGVLQPNTG